MPLDPSRIARAADLVRRADSILIAAGAGMGADSGLPTFRGADGFWKAYPALGRARLEFTEVANPAAFRRQPHLAWGFYGHRLELYRRTPPHAGFALLRDLAAAKPHGSFVFTSNVDGHFQRAGFPEDRVCECHGSIHYLQCTKPCNDSIWPADDLEVDVDTDECRLRSPLPACPSCGELARPNILMFGDDRWLEDRTQRQERSLRAWLAKTGRPVVIEIGAGTNIPTVRMFGERFGDALIRINLDAPEIRGARGVSLQGGGLEALRAIRDAI